MSSNKCLWNILSEIDKVQAKNAKGCSCSSTRELTFNYTETLGMILFFILHIEF